MSVEALNKSLDAIIDELFSEEDVEAVEKSMIADEKPQRETADEAMKLIPTTEDDKKRGAGRSKEISDVPKVDEDGRRESDYDSAIASKNEDGETKEMDQVAPPAHMVKSWESTPEYQEYMSLKKAKEEAAKAEALKKAREEQADLIKSAVIEATSSIRKENEELRKAMVEQAELIKSLANKPQKAKAVTSAQAVERFSKSQGSETLSKAQVLDIAETLANQGQLSLESVIELEQTGFISNPADQRAIESAVAKLK